MNSPFHWNFSNIFNLIKKDDDDLPSSNHVGVDMLFAPLNPANLNTLQGMYPMPGDTAYTRMSRFYKTSTVAGSESIGRVRHPAGHLNRGRLSLWACLALARCDLSCGHPSLHYYHYTKVKNCCSTELRYRYCLNGRQVQL